MKLDLKIQFVGRLGGGKERLARATNCSRPDTGAMEEYAREPWEYNTGSVVVSML